MSEEAVAETNGTGHGPNGDFIRTPEQAEIDAEAARLRSRSMSYPQIARAMGCSQSTAYERVQRALKAIVREPAEAVVKMELEKLERLERKCLQILDGSHVLVSQGRVITSGTGEETVTYTDPGPVLAAARELRQINESRRKLLGLDAAAKVDLSGGVRFEMVGIQEDLL